MSFETATGPAPVTKMPLSAASGIYQASTPALHKWLSGHEDVTDLRRSLPATDEVRHGHEY